jgi:hypothetical protein
MFIRKKLSIEKEDFDLDNLSLEELEYVELVLDIMRNGGLESLRRLLKIVDLMEEIEIEINKKNGKLDKNRKS